MAGESRSRRQAAVVGIASGATLAVGLPTAWHLSHPAPSARVVAINPGAATRLASPRPPSPAVAVRERANSPARGSRPTLSRPASANAVPIRLEIPALRIAAPVTVTGVDPAGNLAVPQRVRTVGWYRFSARPGADAGSIVLVGHVDSADQGLGAFFRLHEAGAGMRVRVTVGGGRVLSYRVVSRQAYPKTAVPLAAIFSLAGLPRLTLVTCGGSFDAAARSYRDNVVITAVPEGRL